MLSSKRSDSPNNAEIWFFSKAMSGLQNILRIPQPVLHATVQQECDDCHQLLEHVSPHFLISTEVNVCFVLHNDLERDKAATRVQ